VSGRTDCVWLFKASTASRSVGPIFSTDRPTDCFLRSGGVCVCRREDVTVVASSRALPSSLHYCKM